MGCVLLLAAYFVWFNWESVRVPFAADDLMNLAEHWRHPWREIYGNFLLWRDFYRPMGGMFYVPIFRAFGLNPAPFHAALLALVLLYVGLAYRLARVLGAEPLEAWLAALILAYHAGIANLYYETSHIYDVLCGIFYAGALIAYARPRSQGRAPRPGETAAFFALFLAALNSKEMAVTLPAMLLAYEWIYRRGKGRTFWTIGIAGVMAAVAIYGRVLVGLLHAQGYAATFSLARVADFQRQQFEDLFFAWKYDGWVMIAAVWLAATYVAWRTGRPLLRFAWIFIVVTPLPLEVLEARRMAALAVPFLGWAMLAAVAALGVARALAGAVAGDPGFRRLSPNLRLGVVLGVMIVSWAAWNRMFYVRDIRKAMFETGAQTAEVIRAFQAVRPQVRPRSTVVFLNDPFDGWDMAFIAELWFHDRTVTVRLQKKTPLPAEELARADYLFDWRGGRLVPAGGAATTSGSPRP